MRFARPASGSARRRDERHAEGVLEDTLAPDEQRSDPECPVFSSGTAYEDQSALFVGMLVAEIAEPAHREIVSRFLGLAGDTASTHFGAMVRADRYGGDDPEGDLERRFTAFRRGFEGVG